MKLPQMPSLPSLKRDPKAALAKAQLELTQAEGKLSELAMQRGLALVDSDDVAAVAAIDQQLADQHRTITILTDRCQALANQVWKLDHERREAERTAAIAELEKGFAEAAQACPRGRSGGEGSRRYVGRVAGLQRASTCSLA